MKIIAPAGDIERMKASIKGGADEVYLGLKGFGARRSAINFTISELKDAIDYAHLRGVKVLLTLNTIMKDSEIDSLYMNLSTLYEHGLDVVIVQDLGVFRYLKDNFKDLEIHGSTQMTVANHVEANYLYNLGFKRVVLSRELSFEEIKTIRKKTKIELEVFVSGALCISYSGNCYISSFIGSRSGNRGMCAQVCRKKYTTSKDESGYLLSPKDQMLDKVEIEKLKDAGINAIKIEGRMKSPNYVYEMVGKYNDILMGTNEEHHPEKIFNRGYSKGYFYKNDGDKLMNSQYASNYGYSIGDVRGRILKLNTTVILGDGIAYLDKDMNILQGEYLNQIIIMGKKVKEAKRLDLINIYPPKGTKFIYKTFDKALNDSIESTLKTAKGRMSIGGKFFAHVGEPIRFDIYTNGRTFSIIGDILEEAQKRPLDNETIFEKLGEMGNSTLKLSNLDIEYDGKAFVSLKTLKDIKRQVIEKFENEYLATTRRILDNHELVGFIPTISENDYKTTVAVSVVNKSQFKVAKEFGIKKIYYRGPEVAKESNLDKIDTKSRLASNLYQLIQNENDTVSVDYNFNIANSRSIEEFSKMKNVGVIYLSPEFDLDYLSTLELSKCGMMVYGHLTGMYIENLNVDANNLTNENGDNFKLYTNKLGNTQVLLEKPMNIISRINKLKDLGLAEVRLDFLLESEFEMRKILESIQTGIGEYVPYNLHKGVF
ncbi:U32 family peptidase [Psychrilyobacter sp.]|uniref:peptidase U32 family protein n=1 Tax=Psychrilyobacter sp. TaxID=2586924 RepID=UPI00301A170D